MPTMRLSTLLALASALGVAACGSKGTSGPESSAPVLAIAAPAHASDGDHGQTVLPLHSLEAGADGARFVMSPDYAPALAIVSLDARGAATVQKVQSAALAAVPLINSLAEIPGTNQVLLGAPNFGAGGSVLLLTMGSSPDVTVFDTQAMTTQAIDRFGLAVAAGHLAGTDAPDFVVASGNAIDVYVDGDPHKRVAAPTPKDTCFFDLPPSLGRMGRGLVVGPLMGAAGGEQIVVGTPGLIVAVFMVDATGAATCAFAYDAPASDDYFGGALATGDFDGDGVLDLLIGAPRSHAYWIRGPLTADSALLPIPITPGPSLPDSGSFGSAVAAGNLDGQGGDEAIIGDRSVLMGGDVSLGEVRIGTGPMLDAELASLRFPASVTGDEDFGGSVAAMPFCSSGCGTASAATTYLPLVGSTRHAFVDFTFGPTDPRMP